MSKCIEHQQHTNYGLTQAHEFETVYEFKIEDCSIKASPVYEKCKYCGRVLSSKVVRFIGQQCDE